MRLLVLLVLLGLAWGLSVPLTKFAVNAGYRDFGIIFWQSLIVVVILYPLVRPLPRHHGALAVYAYVGLVGSLLPWASSINAAVYLPAGVVALGLSFVPLIALPVAVAFGTDRFTPMRIIGLLAGLAGVVLMIAPGAGLAGAGLAHLFPLALIAPIFYAFEGNVLARWGTAGLRPAQMVCGASMLTAALAGPIAALRGDFIVPGSPFLLADAAVIIGAVVNLAAYVGYLWMIGRAGAVFAAQVSYLVTGFGIVWSMILLGERFPSGYWLALAVTMAGVFLVQPRPPRLRQIPELATTAPDGPKPDSTAGRH